MTELLGNIGTKIYELRGVKVMLDRDLAELYGVTTGNLNKAVKRNKDLFPEDFMFQLDQYESDCLVFHFGISKKRGGSRYFPYVFTEQGVAMLSGVLKSDVAKKINIKIMRAFVELRRQITTTPAYDLLKEKIKRIESDARQLRTDTIVSTKTQDEKLKKLSSEVSRLTQIMDGFQDSYVVVKRPEIGMEDGN